MSSLLERPSVTASQCCVNPSLRDFSPFFLGLLGSNPEAWDPLNKDLQFTHQGKACEVKSTITPSAHFLKDNLVNPQFKRGVAAGDRLSQTRHIPNLAQTELKNGEGKKIFSALRHGVLDAYKVSGKNLRALPETKLRSILTDLVGSDPAKICLLYTSPSPRDRQKSRMPSSA